VGKQTPQFELLLANSEINIPQKQIENANRRRGESKNGPNSFGIRLANPVEQDHLIALLKEENKRQNS
jgi:hypothetical protein